MFAYIGHWFKQSIARAIFLALIVLSVLPIIVVSVLLTRQSTVALTSQMEANLSQLAEARAEEINLRLQEVGRTTEIAAHQATQLLQQPIAAPEIEAGMARYAPDQRNILGLDAYYSNAGGDAVLGEALSNVYWPAPTADPTVARQIIQTEALDVVFEGIKEVSPDTQWIYVTTPEGMMRLYPWASNDHYPDDWDPREIVFYTVAEPGNNSEMTLRWTAPYVDFAGAGWMVTASTPLVTAEGDYLGVMSHDVTIGSIKEIALEIEVLNGAGYGFLIDGTGGVISHPDYQDTEAGKGTQEGVTLLNVGTPSYQSLIEQMVNGASNFAYYDNGDSESLLVFAPVESTGWSLGITVPREAVIAPAAAMRTRVIFITLGLIGLAVALAVLVTRLIHRPLVQLLQGVNQISADSRADEIEVNSFDELSLLAEAFNKMAQRVWERETTLKRKVAALSIQIDQRTKAKGIEAIVETDFFKRLETNARQMRTELKSAPISTD